MRYRLFPYLAGAVVLVGAFVGCESSFDPFEESDIQFSIFGYVDVAADTQFVRVSSLRRSVEDTGALEAEVTLEDLTRGGTTALRDSVVRFGNGAVVHNFWTSRRIEPSTAYRLTATGPDGNAASAEFETPPQFPNPTLESGITIYSSPQFPPMAQAIFFEGIEKFADLRVVYHLEEPSTTVVLSYLDRIIRTGETTHSVSFSAYEDVQRALTGSPGVVCPRLQSARVFVAAATDAWPDLADLDSETLALPTTVANVEGGLGFVGGVITRERTWEGMNGVFSLHWQGCQE